MRRHVVRFVLVGTLVVGFLVAAGLLTAAFFVASVTAGCVALLARAHDLLVPVRAVARTRALLAA
jgi:hypothetical protein